MDEVPAVVETEQVDGETTDAPVVAKSDDAPGVDKSDEPKADGDDAGEEGDEKEGRERRGKTLDQMMSLKEGDDERTQISKKVSWILRHGARKVNIEIDDDGWVTLENLLAHDSLLGTTEEKLLDVVEESNQQKVRYEIKEPAEDGSGKAIKAVSKHTISGMAGTVAREQRRAERETRRDDRQNTRVEGDNGAGGGEQPGRPERPEQYWQGDRSGPAGSARPAPAASGGPDGGMWGRGFERGDDDEQGGDEASYEQQLKEGFRPVYQGNRVVAMVKEGNPPTTAKPGRRMKGDYGKGKGYGKDHEADSYGGGGGYNSYGGGGYGGGGGGYGGGGGGMYHGGHGGPGGRSDYWPEKGGGKGGGYRDQYGGGKYGGAKGYGKDYYEQGWQQERRPQYNAEPSQKRQYWRVIDGQEAIMRASEAMESQAIMTLKSGQLVLQTGEHAINQHGIIRMPVETADDGTRGWVTRTAEAAQGPAFFRPDSGPNKGQASKGGGGKGKRDGRGYDGGKGKGK